MMDGDIIMTILKRLPSSFENLIVAMETKNIKELIFSYITTWLMHAVIKKKEHQVLAMENAVLVVCQNSVGNSNKA